METPFVPSWNRVVSAMPNVLEELKAAVEADNLEYAPNSTIMSAVP